ncbi:MAG TPA: class A beta-lactamase [Chitinophagales bacterium]|nr:class A beta-lactamase [Chitinophagales bacterium]HNM31796.1 class A beta-lactamase [Chitinophagales bacterium]
MVRGIFISLLYIIPIFTFAQPDSLWNQIHVIAENAQGKVCVSARIIEDSSVVQYYGDELCPMQSTFKFPIALAILNRIDKKEFTLNYKIHITPKDLIGYDNSLARDSFQNGNINVTFNNLIRYMTIYSDNISCDALLHHLGNPKVVSKFIRKFGIEDFDIKYNEKKMGKQWRNQYKNISSANAMTELLVQFYLQKILSPANTEYLYQVMTETQTGKDRIVKLLPSGTVVAHKTGTSNTQNGIRAAVNDCGIITLPNGKHLALTIFIKDSKAAIATAEATIAQIAKLIFDDFSLR